MDSRLNAYAVWFIIGSLLLIVLVIPSLDALSSTFVTSSSRSKRYRYRCCVAYTKLRRGNEEGYHAVSLISTQKQ